MSQYFTLLTDVGAAKLANATALGQSVQLEKLAVGDGNGVLPTPKSSQTSLINERRKEALNSVSIDENNANYIICEQVIPESEGGYYIREIGIFDDAGDLIAVGNFPETYKPILQEGSGRTQTIRCVIMVNSSDTATVELKIDPSVVLATREYIDNKFSNTGLGGVALNVSSTDIKLLRDTGFYRGNKLINAPNGSQEWFYFRVEKHSNSYFLIEAFELENAKGRSFIGFVRDGNWSGWDECLLSSKTGNAVGYDVQASPLDNNPNRLISTNSGLVDFISTQGRKNILINGKPQVWQNGENFSSTGYTADQWYTELTAATCIRDANPKKGLHVSVVGLGGFGRFHQLIEAPIVKGFQGEDLTVSFEYAVNSLFSGDLKIMIFTSATSDLWVDSNQLLKDLVFTPSEEGTGVESLTFTVPASAIGLRVSLVPVDAQPVGSEFALYHAQLEKGKTNTPFELTDYTGELLRCYRYFQPWNMLLDTYVQQFANMRVTVPFRVQMRVAPDVVIMSTAGSSVNNIEPQAGTQNDFLLRGLGTATGHNTIACSGYAEARL